MSCNLFPRPLVSMIGYECGSCGRPLPSKQRGRALPFIFLALFSLFFLFFSLFFFPALSVCLSCRLCFSSRFFSEYFSLALSRVPPSYGHSWIPGSVSFRNKLICRSINSLLSTTAVHFPYFLGGPRSPPEIAVSTFLVAYWAVQVCFHPHPFSQTTL